MGKKSKRPKNEHAAAIRTLTTFNRMTQTMIESLADGAADEKLAKQLLDDEPKVLDAITKIRDKPGACDLGVVYYNLGNITLSGNACLRANINACDKAVTYFKKATELDLAIDDKTGLLRYDGMIINSYLLVERWKETVVAFKTAKLRLTKRHPTRQDYTLVEKFVLDIADKLTKNGTYEHAAEVLESVWDEIEQFWGAPSQKLAFGILASYSGSQNELRNEIMYYEKFNSLHRQNPGSDDRGGMILGMLYRKCCKYHVAMDHLQSALVFWKKSKADNYRKHIADIYIEMGWVYLDYGFGHEQNAMQVFGRALSKTKRISNAKKEGPSAKALRGIGIAYYDLGDWGRAIIAFENSLVACNEAEGHIYLGYVYLEKCLRLPPDTDGYVRADVMDCALGHDMMNQYKKLSKIGVSMALYSESEGIFLGVKLEVLRRNIDGAKTSIKQLFDTEINGYDDDVVYCHCCNQRHGESVELKKCAGCKVRYYCSKRHQKDKWRGRFIDHRMLCPYLNRWRRVKRRMKKEERSRDTLDSILNDFVEVIERVYINKYGVFIPGK